MEDLIKRYLDYLNEMLEKYYMIKRERSLHGDYDYRFDTIDIQISLLEDILEKKEPTFWDLAYEEDIEEVKRRLKERR